MDTDALVSSVQSKLEDVADPEKARPMAAYMKTVMPFYGVQKAGRTTIMRTVKGEFPPATTEDYEEAVRVLWSQPHREEKYLAIAYAKAFPVFVEAHSMLLYEQLIVEGAWWDLVDDVAPQLVGRVLVDDPTAVEPIVRAWIGSDDMWLRRSSIICQLKAKAATDTQLLDDACTVNLADTEFFIRKAIGWALREYAKTDPDWVGSYVAAHRDELSRLSYREATKHF